MLCAEYNDVNASKNRDQLVVPYLHRSALAPSESDALGEEACTYPTVADVNRYVK